jgi:hypothetical protein
VLREAYLNQMWPKCHKTNPPEDNFNEQIQIHESVSMTSINDPEELALL